MRIITFIHCTIALAAIVLPCGCGWTSDHLVSPSQPAGYIPSPPRYVRVTDWIRPDLFEGEYYQSGKWYRDSFMIITKDTTDAPLSDGWFAPDWSRMNPMPDLSAEEELARQAMVKAFPPGSGVSLDYPLLDDKSKIGKDRNVDVRRPDVRATASWFGAYAIVVLNEDPPEDVFPDQN